MLTKEELDAIRGRCEKATPNPELTRYDHGGGRSFLQTGDWESLHGKRDRKLVADYYNEEDREFYHQARTDIPALLAHIEELEKKVYKYETLAISCAVDISKGTDRSAHVLGYFENGAFIITNAKSE